MLAAAGCLLAVAVLTLAGWGLLQVRAELNSQCEESCVEQTVHASRLIVTSE